MNKKQDGRTVLVCGGRDFSDRRQLFEMMDLYNGRNRIGLIVEGGARGADSLAREWANCRAIVCKTVRAEWDIYGNRAGFIRNQRMLDEQRPDYVVAFAGGVGTADMMRRARQAGIEVRNVAKLTEVAEAKPPSATTPRVLNKRKHGIPAGAVYIGRPSKWGNPFIIGHDGNRNQVIARYRAWLVEQPDLMAALDELRGRNLVCWCAPEACHGDVLSELANR